MLCKYCGNPVSARARICPMCGRTLIEPEEIKTAAAPQKKRMKRLPFAFFTVLLFALVIFCMVIEQASVLYPESFANVFAKALLELSRMLPAVMTLLYCFFCVRRRLVDIGKSPSKSLLVMLPVFGQLYLVYLCFKKSVPLSASH